jgi:MFS family permease
VGLTGFVWLESRTADPVLNVGLFRRNRVFLFSSLASFINYAATYAMTFLMSLYLRYNMNLGPETAALVLITGAVMQTVVSPLSGRLSDRVPARYIASAGMAVCVLGLGAFIFLGMHSPYWYIILTIAVLGLGFGFFATPIVHSMMGSVERRYAGVASAAIGTVRLAGQSISIGLATLVLAVVMGSGVKPAEDLPGLLTSIRVTFAVFTVLCIVGIAASLVGPRKSGESAATPKPTTP